MFRKIRYQVETNKIFEDFLFLRSTTLLNFLFFFYYFPVQQRVINSLEAIVNFLWGPVGTI